MALKSYMQTVEVTMPNSTSKFLTMKLAPPRLKFPDDCMCTYQQRHEDKKMTVFWELLDIIRIEYDDGTHEMYHPKPNMNVAINNNIPGQYYRRHVDGSVEHKYDNECYYYGPDQEVEWDMTGITPVSVGCHNCYHAEEDYYDDYVHEQEEYEENYYSKYGCYPWDAPRKYRRFGYLED